MLGGMAISWPLAARAQKAISVVGYLGAGPSGPDVAAFREGLSETGYVDGKRGD
jgi:putative tryptophan/tyrosine transport system substrate-binding protein